ncbi:MAG: hypothetical protein LDL39_12860 [Magnetospirillum sp.]|nr:hypothetical protein [Magnetospirillum sp.]
MERFLAIFFMISAFASSYASAGENDVSLTQAHFGAYCGASFEVNNSDGLRKAFGTCKGHMQTIYLVGPPDDYEAVLARVDLRPANIVAGRKFIIEVMRNSLDKSQWPEAQRFLDSKFNVLLVPETAERRFGKHAVKIERTSDETMTVVIAKGTKAHHRAFDW